MATGQRALWRSLKRQSNRALPAIGARCGLALAAVGLSAALLLSTSAATAQTVRALVIGIDDYVEHQDLAGAVNDARDLAGTLSRAGVDDLVVLENGAATRDRIAAEWRGMMARADRGDTLVLTYAGHGGQEPERIAGNERDGLDEALLLGGLRSTGPGTRERILDDELNLWFSEAGERGLRVVFVADSCHAGTLTRSVDPRVPKMAVRSSHYTITDDMLSLEMPDETAALEEDGLPHVSFLAAGQEYEKVPELALHVVDEEGRIEETRREPRGALSYMFARAVDGEADRDGDQVLLRSELWSFVRERVRSQSGSRQTPNLLPNARGGEPVLRISREAAAPDSAGGTPDSLASGTGPLRLTVLNAGSATLGAVQESLAGVTLVPIEALPDLIWDAQRLQVLTGLGDVAAYDVNAAALPAVIGKWAAVRAIKALSARASLRLRVRPHDGLHRSDSVIRVEIDGLDHPHFTLFAIAGDGTVYYLYPESYDPAQVATDEPFRLPLKVEGPFGADHVIAISAARPLDALNAALKSLHGQPVAEAAAALMADAAGQAEGWQSGIQGLFTGP